MALIKCKECGNEVSTEAKTCPKCGARVRPSSGCLPALGYFAGGSVALVFVIYAIGSFFGPVPQGSGPHGTGCRTDWTKCADNSDLANNFEGWSGIGASCQIAAENQARYGTPKWPMLPFGTFIGGSDYVKKGVAIAIENNAQFQNGFGAMVHAKVTCFYDLNAQSVKDVIITPH